MYAQMDTSVQLQVVVMLRCLLHHAQRVSGVVLEYLQIPLPLYASRDISA